MRDSMLYKILSILFSVQLVFSLVPCEAVAEQLLDQADGNQDSLTTEVESTGKPDGAGTNTPNESGANAPDGSSEKKPNASGTNNDSSSSTEDVEEPNSSTSSVLSAPAQPSDDGVNTKQEIRAESSTQNIVGEVFANAVNEQIEQGPQSGQEGDQKPVLEDAARESHDEDYYAGSARLRTLEDTSGTHLGFMVYRDSYLMISQEESKNYTVSWSENKRTAYVTPAISTDQLADKTGIVFLSDNVGADEVLVFDGTPTIDGDTLVVPVAATDDLTLSDLFSDGSLRLAAQSDMTAEGAGFDYEGFDEANDGLKKKNLVADGWSADISNLELDDDVGCWLDIDLFELKFDLVIHLGANFDFDVRSNGTPCGRESQDIASLSIPVKLFTLKFQYKFEAEFDDKPVYMAGSMKTSMDYHISPIFGMHVENFQAPVTIKQFSLINPTTVEETHTPANEDINCYVGSAFQITQGFLGLDIDLWFIHIKIGPVVSLNHLGQGGAHITAKLEKGTYDPDTFDRTSANSVHLCAEKNKVGCYGIHTTEVSRNTTYLKLDLFFASWEWNLSDDGEKTVAERDFYRSLTKQDQEVKPGVCPHHLYKVPVQVWAEDLNHTFHPVPSMSVYSSARSEESDLMLATTGDDGKAIIFLPYGSGACYSITAEGEYGGLPVKGTEYQPQGMVRGENPEVTILIGATAKTTVKTQLTWDVDVDEKDEPTNVVIAVQMLNQYTHNWETVAWLPVFTPETGTDAAPLHPTYNNWTWEHAWPKYSLVNGAYVPNQFRVFELKEVADVTLEESLIDRVINSQDYLDVFYREDVNEQQWWGYKGGQSPDMATFPNGEGGLAQILNEIEVRKVESTTQDPTPFVPRSVGAYTDSQDLSVPNHRTTYQVSYATDTTSAGTDGSNIFETTINHLAVADVHINKEWKLAERVDKPEQVYLALQQKPQAEWEDYAASHGKNYAGTVGVPTVLVTALNPIEGQATTLRQLMQDNVLNPISVQGIADVPLAIAKVRSTGDDAWSTDFTVRKYRNGIPLQFQAAELDTNVVKMLLNYEFGVNESAVVTRSWTGASIPGLAYNRLHDARYYATVTNTDTDPEHTIGGTIFWYNTEKLDHLPEKVKITVRDARGNAVKTFDVSGPKSESWSWTLTDDAIDSTRSYTVSEEFYDTGASDSQAWVSDPQGLDVINHWTYHEDLLTVTLEASIEAPADNEVKPEAVSDGLSISLKDESGIVVCTHSLSYSYENKQFYTYQLTQNEIAQLSGKDLAHYTIQVNNADVCSKTSTVYPVYSEPSVTIDTLDGTGYHGAEQAHYTFHVTNVVQWPMLFDFDVEWKNAAGESTQPPEGTAVNVRLYQDTTQVGPDIQITKDGQGHWKYADFGDNEVEPPLMPMRDESHRYDYSIDVTTHVAGYSTKVAEDKSEPLHPKYTITYTALDPDNRVDVQGTVAWAGDDEHKDLRPNTVHLALVAQNGDDGSTARTVQHLDVTVNKDSSTEDTWIVKDLPRYADDAKTVPIKYSVLESHVMGYTTEYPTPTFDESANPPTWTCNVTNTLSAYLPLTIQKKIANKADAPAEQTFTFNIAAKKLSGDDERTYPDPRQNNIQITDEGTNKFEFIIEKTGVYAYTIEEAESLLPKPWTCASPKRNVLISAALGTDGKMSYHVWVSDPKDSENNLSYTTTNIDARLGGYNIPSISNLTSGTNTLTLSANQGTSLLGEELPDDGTKPIVFTNGYGKKFEIKKDWEIDLQHKDKPASIQVAIQKKKAQEGNDEETETWETVDLVELSDANAWTEVVYLNEETSNEGTEYRVRELKEETALEELGKNIKECIAHTNLDSLKSALTSSSYWEKVPDAIKTKVNESATVEDLAQKLGTSTSALYDKLMDVLGIASASDRIVYDSEDKDKPKDEEGNDKETNRVIYSVKENASDSGNEEGNHKTKYQVTYDKSDDTYSITNKAILEIDVIKRWIAPGVDEDKMPKSAWVVLLCKPKTDELQAAQQAGLLSASNSGDAQLFSMDNNETYNVGDIPIEEFPAINPIEGGIDPVNLISQLTIGIPISIFSGILPTIAVAKVDKDCDWTAKFVVSKYAAGVTLEYKGAELVSEIIRQIIKYFTKISLPISFNPFDGYISIPTKAIRTIAGITQVEDLLDFSKLSGAALDKAKTLTMDDIRDFGPSTLLDDYHLMANVINLKFDGDVDPEPEPDPEPGTIYGKKTWDDDDDKLGYRPESIKVYLLANGKRVKDSDGKDLYVETSQAGGWKYFFPNMPEKDDQDKTITYTVEEDPVPDRYEATVNGTNITNKLSSFDLEGKKTWEDNNDKDGLRPQSIIIHLLANGKDVRQLSVSSSDDWEWKFTNVPIYDDQGKKIEYTVEEEPIKGYSTTVDGLDVTNTHTSEMTDVLVRKIWRDNDDQDGKRPETVTLHLFADGAEVDSAEVTASDDWQHTFTAMPVHNKDGKRIAYTVGEDTIEDYTASISGLTITNTYAPGKTQVHVRKTWDDAGDRDGIRPKTVTIKLLANGADTGKTLELAEANSWAGSFSNLDKYDNGKEIAYTIEEVSVDGYETTMSGDASSGFVVSNKHVPETVLVAGKKTWDDAADTSHRPSSITVRLFANGKQVDARTVTEKDGWKWEFKDLPKYEGGKLIRYTVSEDTVEDYTSTVSGYDITNKYTPGKTQIHVSKRWEDEDDQDGIRPKSVTVHLYADDTDTGKTLVLNKGNNWEGSFTDLDKTKDGKDILYHVEEDAIKGYKGTVLNNLGGPLTKFFIINKHTPETVDVTGQKTWDDAVDPSHRPSSIVVRLRADGVAVDVRTVTEQDEWKWDFKNLPKYRDGHQIVYTVSEDVVDDYTSAVSKDGYDITNSYTPGKTQVNVSKQWDDAGNQDGIRPTSVTVRLLANGEDVEGKTLELNQENRWSGSFTDLNKTDSSSEILYTVEEVTTDVITGVDGPGTYANIVSGDVVTGFVVTNIHTPELAKVPVSKVWEDADNKDGIRPESVTVRLLEDGEDTGMTLELTAGNEWKGAFERLQKYQDGGKEIAYTVEEVTTDVITGTDGPGTYAFAVSGDATEGFVVTNTHTPGKTQVPVTKVWDDSNNKDGIRPESVTVRLLADGKDTGQTLVLSADNKWAGTFTDLDKYSDGETLVAYTVEEVATDVITGTDGVGTYAFAVSGDATDGFVVTNKHTPDNPNTKMYTITYVLNGGTYEGSKADIKERYPAGTVISIHKAPVRDGYTFTYWKGSEHQPGDKYTVTGDHTFVAQWKQSTTPSNPSSNPSANGTTGTTSRTQLASTADASFPQALAIGMAALGLALCGAAVLRRRRA